VIVEPNTPFSRLVPARIVLGIGQLLADPFVPKKSFMARSTRRGRHGWLNWSPIEK